ncbi:hypothetical protein K3495_g14051 [Podosphaera aphanis]|nr:hypothetical protein K3495_g14051 [Podosphaera aphanis]
MSTYQNPMSDDESDAGLPELRQELDGLRQQIAALQQAQTPLPHTQDITIIKDPAAPNGVQFRPTPLPEYDGNKSNYPGWRQAVLDIFRMDWHNFGYTDTRAFLLIYTALKGEARTKAGPFYETGGVDGTKRPEDFIAFLDRGNLDNTRSDRACDQLYSLRMNETQRWSSFFLSWAAKLTEARGDIWSDETKITMLRNALNDPIRRALSGNHLLPRDNYGEWVRIVGQIAHQVEDMASRGRRNPHIVGIEGNLAARPYGGNGGAGPNRSHNHNRDYEGDVRMGGVNGAGAHRNESEEDHAIPSGRSQWKSPAQIARLRRERRCYRCERKGCSTRTCPMQPAENSRQVNVSGPAVAESNDRIEVVREIDFDVAESEN